MLELENSNPTPNPNPNPNQVGLPVAMGNAIEALKSPRNVAFVTDSNTEDGVAKVSGLGLGSGLRLGLGLGLAIMRPHHATHHQSIS